MSTFPLRIGTPDGLLYEGEVARLVCRTINGDLAILPRHCNYCTALGMGEAHIVLETIDYIDRSYSGWKNRCFNRTCQSDWRRNHFRRFHAGLPPYGYRICKDSVKRDARDLAPSDRCAGAGGRVPCGEIPADGKRSAGWDLSERTYPHCCRWNWVLYPGSVV